MSYSLVGTTPSDEQGRPTNSGAINGGLLAKQPPITSVVITIDVPDIDATLETISRLGGTVLRGKEASPDWLRRLRPRP